jgi:hypothetical protein
LFLAGSAFFTTGRRFGNSKTAIKGDEVI